MKTVHVRIASSTKKGQQEGKLLQTKFNPQNVHLYV